MKKDKTKKSKFIEIFALVVIIVSIFMITDIYNEEIKNTNAEPLSNKKIGWGIKRNDNHEQPDVGSANKNILEQYNGIALGNNEKKYIYLTFDEGYEAGYTRQILSTLKENNVKEIILALSSTIEGETTALFLAKLLAKRNIETSRIANGLPIGSNIDYADELTLLKSLEGRKKI